VSAAFHRESISIHVIHSYLFLSLTVTVVFARIGQNQSSVRNVNELKRVGYLSAHLFMLKKMMGFINVNNKMRFIC